MTEQTPLEALTAMNERAGKSRRRQARVRDYRKRVQQYYNAQLQSLVRLMAREVRENIIPVIKQERDDYRSMDAAPDPQYTRDTWSDLLLDAWRRTMERFFSESFQSQYERIAQRTVSMANAESTEAFVESVNKAVGVDIRPMMSESGMQDYINVANQQNVQLIRSVPEQYFGRIESIVLGGVRDGDAPTLITRRIQEATGVTQRQAKTIARDQTAKLTSEITERRQRQSGVKYYRSVDAGDERVTGRPGGKYPNAKISCWGIARKDIGYGPGVYRWDKGASWGGQTGLHPGRHHINCRCTATPVFEWELPGNEDE